ncbi:MAG: glycoside hydrolase/phage tail family protein, partial [Hyphomicrobiaceae bacterium]
MATLALAAVGAAVGSTLLPAGISVLGATVSGATIGAQIGAFAGSYVDQMLLGPSGGGGAVHGPRLSELHVTSSTEGAPMPRVYGQARLGGQVIWADEIEEEAVTSSAGGGGKGLGGGGATSVSYRYHASFAVAIAEGAVTGIGRIWADGRELELGEILYRVHLGEEDQAPDELIVARMGAAGAPAYRGVAYIVFERLALADFGNRIPQLSFEVHRDLDPLSAEIRAVVMIPGSGEFAYAITPVTRSIGAGSSLAENVHTLHGGTDWSVALDQLQSSLPNVAHVSLITSWFGTDLRAGNCEITPKVDAAIKATAPMAWSVAGLTRATAPVVSQKDGRPVYGGTPSDNSVIEAIRDLKQRGYGVTLTPFVLMDIPPDNALVNPYTRETPQPSYPWRGRVTCDPAPGVLGTVDKSMAAAEQIAGFCGTAAVSDFAIAGETVAYSGPAEWSFRRMVLHYAHLAKAAGGVDAFVIGSELRGLTRVRSSTSDFPFVDALVALAADVKAILGPATKVTYAADWSEYFGYHPADGSGDVYFHLDPLWASPDIDAIGIDLYWPLADWRYGTGHADAAAGARSIYDVDYMAANTRGGEGFDWYYATDSDREQQVRTPITDGLGKAWTFRYKDIASWWSNQHYNRPGGVEAPTPTEWVAQSKPFWFMEIGCPAVDMGANQPNVFVDSKSAENALPYQSKGLRDDLVQRQYLRALIGAFEPTSAVYAASGNPISTVYGRAMVDTSRVFVYAWDARPFPAFPQNGEAWGDGENWRLGHWINGRIASAPLARVVEAIMRDFGFTDFDATALRGVVTGYVVDRVMSLRDALQPLGLAHFFDALESGGKIVFRHRYDNSVSAELDRDQLVEVTTGAPLLTLTRGQETELPAATKLSYIAAGDDYRQAVTESRRLTGASQRIAQAELPVVMEAEQAARISETWLYETWVSRERATLALAPSMLAVEAADVIDLAVDGDRRLFRIIEIGDSGTRTIEARAADPAVYDAAPEVIRQPRAPRPVPLGQPAVYFLDLPLLKGDQPAAAGFVAARLNPWPGSLAVYASAEDSGFTLKSLINASATIGVTESELAPGPVGRLDMANTLIVRVEGKRLASTTSLQLLSGRNAAAVRTATGDWEVLQFEIADLIGEGTYRLSRLLRGQAGSDDTIAGRLASGAPFVLLDEAVTSVPITLDEIGLPLQWRIGP